MNPETQVNSDKLVYPESQAHPKSPFGFLENPEDLEI